MCAADQQMALSQKDLLRRIKQQGKMKIGASSKKKSSPSKIGLESETETTQSDPNLKKRKVGIETERQTLQESDSNDRPIEIVKVGVGAILGPKKSFWDDEFKHEEHGRVNNYSPADKAVLSKRDLVAVHEELL